MGKIITITGTEGGCGKSSDLVMMANLLCYKYKKQVLVIDAHYPQYSIRNMRADDVKEIFGNTSNDNDICFFREAERTAIRYQMENISVKPYDIHLSREANIVTDLKENVDKFDFVLIDIPRYYQTDFREIIKYIDYVFVPFNFYRGTTSNDKFALELQEIRKEYNLFRLDKLYYYWNFHLPKDDSAEFLEVQRKLKQQLPFFEELTNKIFKTSAMTNPRMINTLTPPIGIYSYYGNIQNTIEEMCSKVLS